MTGKDLWIGAAGALVIVTAVLGVVVVEERAGPFVHDLDVASPDVRLTGTYSADAARHPLDLPGECEPVPPVIACIPPSAALELQAGLVVRVPGLHLVAFLAGPDGNLAVGALVPNDAGAGLVFASDEDLTMFDELLLHAETTPDAVVPTGPLLFRSPFDTGAGQRSASFDEPLKFPWADAVGVVRLSQIGAVEVSALARGEAHGLTPYPGFAYRAWLVAPTGHVHLGDFAFSAEQAGEAGLDVRVERVRIADFDRVLVTLEPEGAAGDGPAGLPVFASR